MFDCCGTEEMLTEKSSNTRGLQTGRSKKRCAKRRCSKNKILKKKEMQETQCRSGCVDWLLWDFDYVWKIIINLFLFVCCLRCLQEAWKV